MIETQIYSAFPGVGKSYFHERNKSISIDSDSSRFTKGCFPGNYIDYIKSNIGKVKIILVSSHKSVRDALVDCDIFFNLVYPSAHLKDEYIQRYIDRNNDSSFISLVDSNWYNWIDELRNQKGCLRIELMSGQYLSNIIV